MIPGLRLAHLTDLHITEGPRLADQAEILEGIVRQAVQLGVQATLLTGDLYGRTVPHRSTPKERNVLVPAVRALARLGPVVVVPGNHDYPGDLDILGELGGGMDWPVVVANRPRVIKLQTPGVDLHVYAVPWPTKRILLQGQRVPGGPEATRQLASDKLHQLLGLWAARVKRTREKSCLTAQVLAAHCMTAGARTSGGEDLSGIEIELRRDSMEALGIDYGALGHLHYRQQVAERCWYGGDPWAVDFGETEDKGWHLVDVLPNADRPEPSEVMDHHAHTGGGYGANPVWVHQLPTHSRRWITLDWRWAADSEDGAPRWVTEPAPDAYDQVPDAEVRARLVVPQQWVAGCPWDSVLADLRARGAHRITPQRVVEPVHRVRAPMVAAADTPLDKLQAYWGTLATRPDPVDAAAATAMLADLLSQDDEAIRGDTDRLLTQD